MISMIGGGGAGYASILSARNATTPRPRKAAKVISTSGRRERQKAIRLRSMVPACSLSRFVVDENGAARDHAVAGVQPVADLDAAALLHAERHHAALEQ